jgi:hypothetical protein
LATLAQNTAGSSPSSRANGGSAEVSRLSDAAVRTHVEGLLYVMGRETGGRIPKQALGWFAGTEDPGAVAELLDCGFWRDHGDAYEVVHHMDHQRAPDELARTRKLTAARQRRWRRKTADLSDEGGDATP